MNEEKEKNEFDWLESETPRRSQKRPQPVSIGIPVSLFLLFCLVAAGTFGPIVLLPLVVLAALLFWFREPATRFPKGFYMLAFLVLAVMTWNFLTKGPILSNPIASWIYQHTGLDFRGTEATVIVTDDDFEPAPARVPQAAPADTTPGPAQNIQPEQEVAAATNPAETPAKTENPLPKDTNSQAFEAFLNKGLKAVEDEQYAIANQNFKNAFKASPGHPRLKQLAAEFRSIADEKCQDFKAANAKELRHIPNNYYQYAASLTQTVPLKCD